MEKLLKNPTYQNKSGYNGLDLSHVVDFTSSVGHIVPVMWDFLQPGDKVRLQDNLLTRTSPLLSSAFAKIEENVRYFFVPISQIYKPFEQVYNGIQDFGSDFYQEVLQGSAAISAFIPKVSLQQLLYFLRYDAENVQEVVRLMEGIGIPVYKLLDLSENQVASYLTHQVNILPLLAYQKIWYDYFRDSDRIANNPRMYNFDSFVRSDRMEDPEQIAGRLYDFLSIRYCPVEKDVQNNIFVSPLFGSESVNGLGIDTLTRVNQWLSGLSNVYGASPLNPNGTDGAPVPTNDNPTTVYPYVSSNPLTPPSLNTANLRAAFATEKLLEITRRAGKHYDAQILAHFGVDVPTGVDGECFDLGKHTQMLEIGSVIATSDTYDGETGAPLGEIGGKGYQSDTSNQFNFEAKTHGILMAVYYARPRYVYEQDGIDKKLAYVRVSDFPRPEYEDLGMQPVFRLNQELESNSVLNSTISGWQYRYSEVKGSYDRLFAGMRRTLKNWVVSRSPKYLNPSDFYVSPFDINQILVVPYENVEGDSLKESNVNFFDTDPLLHQLSISYQKATKLSTYGISKL